MDASVRNLMMDPEFWRPRLDRLDAVPRQLAVFPRPDLARPGFEVSELRLRAADGARLEALLARPAFGRDPEIVRLRPCGTPETSQVDWRAVEGGETEIVFCFPDERRLEERVLDVLRITQAACTLESVPCGRIVFGERGSATQPPELVLAELIRSKGWI